MTNALDELRRLLDEARSDLEKARSDEPVDAGELWLPKSVIYAYEALFNRAEDLLAVARHGKVVWDDVSCEPQISPLSDEFGEHWQTFGAALSRLSPTSEEGS